MLTGIFCSVVEKIFKNYILKTFKKSLKLKMTKKKRKNVAKREREKKTSHFFFYVLVV